MKILFCGNIESPYIIKTAEKLRANGLFIDVLDIAKGFLYGSGFEENLCPVKGGKFKRYSQIKKGLRNKEYDVVHIQYNSPAYSLFFLKTFKKIGDRLFVSIWGSDFLRKTWIQKSIQKRSYKAADKIIFNNVTLMDQFNDYYKRQFNIKSRLVPFGLDSLELIKNNKSRKQNLLQKYNVPNDRTVISIGYNASPGQQHLEVLEQIQAAKIENIHLLLPMTYGGNGEYLEKVHDAVQAFGYTILKERLSDEEVAEIRIVTDIMIHAQKSDSFSASVQEYMCAGSVVLNGAWLPYQWIRESGMFDITFDSIDGLQTVLNDVVSNLDTYKQSAQKNVKVLWDISSWDAVQEKWNSLYAKEDK